jgi:hypothetical protein
VDFLSVSSCQNTIKRINEEIAKLYKALSTESKKEAELQNKIARAQRGINKNTSPSQLRSKLHDIENYEKMIMNSKKKQADIQVKLSKNQSDLARAQTTLAKEQKKEQDRINEMQRSAVQRQESELRAFKNNLLPSEITSADTEQKEYDFFISHATENKEDVATPLAKKLEALGARVWLDSKVLMPGDSLSRSINQGLAHSRYGIVILSKDYMKKFWTGKELEGLFAKWSGLDNGKKLILPVWHDISKNDVINYSPILADIMALKTSDYTVDEIAEQFYNIIAPQDE